jgi:hypothetical protein
MRNGETRVVRQAKLRGLPCGSYQFESGVAAAHGDGDGALFEKPFGGRAAHSLKRLRAKPVPDLIRDGYRFVPRKRVKTKDRSPVLIQSEPIRLQASGRNIVLS